MPGIVPINYIPDMCHPFALPRDHYASDPALGQEILVSECDPVADASFFGNGTVSSVIDRKRLVIYCFFFILCLCGELTIERGRNVSVIFCIIKALQHLRRGALEFLFPLTELFGRSCQRNCRNSVGEFFRGLLLWLLEALPALVLLAVIVVLAVFLVRRICRGARAKREKKSAAQAQQNAPSQN